MAKTNKTIEVRMIFCEEESGVSANIYRWLAAMPSEARSHIIKQVFMRLFQYKDQLGVKNADQSKRGNQVRLIAWK